jgi:hypothetical protein
VSFFPVPFFLLFLYCFLIPCSLVLTIRFCIFIFPFSRVLSFTLISFNPLNSLSLFIPLFDICPIFPVLLAPSFVRYDY